MARLRRGKRLIADIGSSAIRVCEISQTKAGYQLDRFIQREILIDPALDEESKRKLRIEALKSVLKESKIRSRKVCLAVPGRSVFTRTRTLPPVPEHKISQIVRYEIQQQIPFAIDQIALDYQILNRTEAGGYDVMMAAIKADVVEKHVEILRDVKCSVSSVEVSPLSAYNWLKHAGEFGSDGQCVAMVDLGASTTEIVIERGGQFRFTRPLNIGGDDITAALAKALGSNFADAEKFKRERAFAPTGDPQRDGKMADVLMPILSRLTTEINRSFGYFRTLPGGGSVDRIILTGGGACLRNIVPFFQQHLNMDVRVARPLTGLAIAPGAQSINEHPEQACVVLGLALRRCEKVAIQVDLVPPEEVRAARTREQLFYWSLSFVMLALTALSIIPNREKQDAAVQKRIDELKNVLALYDPKLAANPKGTSEYEGKLNDTKNGVTDIRKRLTDLYKAKDAAVFFLDDLALINTVRAEVGNVWFSSLETTIIVPAPPAATDPGQPAGATGPSISSTGFMGIAPGATVAAVSGGGRSTGNAPVASRFTGNGPQFGAPVAPPIPNGYAVVGYAKDLPTLQEFIKRLKEQPRFKAGVYFSDALVERVFINELYNARTGSPLNSANTAGASRGGGASSDDEEEGSKNSAPSGFVGASGVTRGLTASAFAPKESTVLYFRVDLQFGEQQAAGAATGAPTGRPGAPGGLRTRRR